jgi:dTDP-4-dehydrorhamnose 3,5-epimerase
LNFKETSIKGVFAIDMFHAEDHRGSFTKTFHKASFEEMGLESQFDESFFSINKKGVIRGMHFQLPPSDHAKVVYSTSGIILDVILDLRKDSSTFGQYTTVEISAENHTGVYMPKGVAHGFCCLTDATMVYLTSTMHNVSADSGVHWNSFGMDWPEKQPLMSDRDKHFLPLNKLKSPF